MSALIIFPWFEIKEPLQFDGFELLPFDRGISPAGEGAAAQARIDEVLVPYTSAGVSISNASLLRLAGHDILDDLTDEERGEAFLFSELLAFAGLAQREFFGIGMQYSNSDHFVCYVQGFQEAARGAAVQTRRRDGRNLSYISASSYKVPCPPHVHGSWSCKVDVELLHALLRARRTTTHWKNYYEAIVGFLRANTDSDTVSEQMEAVAMVGAFERALGLTTGDEEGLRKGLPQTLLPRKERAVQDCPLINPARFKGCESVREAWIRDFFRVRGDVAHGKQQYDYPATWPIREHLLLGAFAFPFVIKSLLQNEGCYELTVDDRQRIGAFERLASIHHLAPKKEEDEDNHAWNNILGNAMLDFYDDD